MGNCAGKPKTKEPPVSSRAKIEKQNKPATPPKTEVDQRGPRPDPFTKTSSETKWITPAPKKPEVIVEPEPEPVAEPEPEPVIEQVIDQPEQAQQTSADIAVDDDQKEIDANAVNDFADALSDSCKRVALEEIDIRKDEVEGETIITPDFVEETLIQPIKREDSMKNRIESKTLADYTEETPIEKVTEATQEVEAFIEEEFIAPVERQESLKDRIEGKTFEEYQKAQEEAEDLADVGKEIEAALNELESSQAALDSVRQANLEATIEAVTKPFESAQESEATATEGEVKPEVIEPANEVSEASISAQDEFIQPQMKKQDSEDVSEEIVAESVTDKSIEFENEKEQSDDKSEETEDKSQDTVVEAPVSTPKVAFSEPEIPKSVGFAEPEPVVELQEDFEASFIDRIAEEMINSIILEATRIVEIDQHNDASEKDDSDPFQVSQSSKISMEDNIDDDISIPTDDELEHVSDDEIKVRQLSTDSTDELLNVPSPLARPDEPSPTVMTPAVLKTPDSQTFFPENDQSSEPGDNIYDFVEDELEPGDDIHGLIDSARASREASLKGSQRSINKLVQSIDDDVPDIYSKPDRPSTPERIVDQLQEEASKAEEPVTIARKSSISVSMEALEREGSPTRVEINVAQQSPQILKHTINIKRTDSADKE